MLGREFEGLDSVYVGKLQRGSCLTCCGTDSKQVASGGKGKKIGNSVSGCERGRERQQGK